MGQNATFDVVAAEEKAHKRSVVYNTAEAAGYLASRIGPQMLAVGTGTKDVRTVRTWQDGKSPRSQVVEDRLRALLRAVTMLDEAYDPETARRFLRGSNAALDHEAPLLAIAHATGPAQLAVVLGVVRGFLEE